MIDFIPRRPGSNPMLEARSESKYKLNGKARRAQVLSILKILKRATAREIAEAMYVRGYVNTADRNNAAPRLTELVKAGKVEPVGKKYDTVTGTSVTVFEIRKGEK